MLTLLALHAVAAVAAPALGRRLGRRVFLVGAIPPAATVLWTATRLGDLLDGRPVTQHVEWVPDLGLELGFRLDAFGALMVGLVSGIGVLVFLYATAYFHERRDLGPFCGILVAFAGAMLGLVLADNLLLLFVFWELTSITSFLLIGFEHEKGSARAAALQALLVTGAGGLALLGGLVLLGQAGGTFSLSGLLADPPTGATVTAGLLLVLAGAFTKSAQVPFHFWLPGAMAAPTPVSAYLHSATMVKAGVYLVARLSPAFALVGPWRPLVLTVGLATMIVGGLIALRQSDLKLLLAYGTVSQLGFLVVLLGAGDPELTRAGTVVLLAHGLFKAGLFLVVGVVDHQAGTRDLRRLTGLGRRAPGLFAVAAICAASMAGLPPLLGFVAKEAAYEAGLHAHLGGVDLVLAGLVAGSVLTFAYSARFLWGAFGDKGLAVGADRVGPEVPRPTTSFVAPAAVLAGLSVLLGLAPELASRFLNEAAASLDPAVEAAKLHLFSGLNAALGLSALTIAAGIWLVAARRRVERLRSPLPAGFSGERAYRSLLAGLNRVADASTGLLQSGSLPRYLLVILGTAVVLPGTALLAGGAHWPEDLQVIDVPIQVVLGFVIVTGAVAAARARRRLPAILFLGQVGVGVSALFVARGAPDLALTQMLVETIVLAIFVLVLRHLPKDFAPQRGSRLPQALAALVVGVFVGAFVLSAGAVRTAEPVSAGYVEQARDEAGGRNVVNVILVDFRGYDTLGEITVLTVTALGAVALVRAGRRELATEETGPPGPGPGATASAGEREDVA
ncbi:MAG: proton-conducting transporter membrane subunit [Acidimicrobiia bacterium]|nr:proton-conducting transporter membrane subunit [Acidimicrobiia bacterium]